MTAFCILIISRNQMVVANKGRVFKAIDRGVAEATLEKLRQDGADANDMKIVEVEL